MKLINLPDKFAFTVDQVAELMQCDPQTVRFNIKRAGTDRKYLKAFKVSEREYRIKHEDLICFIERNCYGVAA